jgi:hypothetical protein
MRSSIQNLNNGLLMSDVYFFVSLGWMLILATKFSLFRLDDESELNPFLWAYNALEFGVTCFFESFLVFGTSSLTIGFCFNSILFIVYFLAPKFFEWTFDRVLLFGVDTLASLFSIGTFSLKFFFW